MTTKNILPEIWEQLEKTNKTLARFMDYDNLQSIIVNSDVYWIETLANIPSTAFKALDKFMKTKGYTYLYYKKFN